MNNLTEDKQKALRIYGAICEDFDAEHYSSCVNLIKKNRELLASFLSANHDEKIYKIYAYSIFTMIEDSYLAGNTEQATTLLKNYETLLDNHLNHDAKKALEGYKTGEIPEIGNEISKEELKFDPTSLKEELEHTKTSWTVTDNNFDSVLRKANIESEKAASKKNTKFGVMVAIIMALLVACGIFFASPLLEYFMTHNITNNSTDTTVAPPTKTDAPQPNLEVMVPPPAPPVEELPEIEIPTDPNSLISPNISVNADGYILPTDSRLITVEELANFDQKMVRLATNEMFARKGFAFSSTGEYYNYFCQFSWYGPNADLTIDQAESMFSETEKANLLTLLNFNS